MRHTATFSCRSPRAAEIFRALSPEMEEVSPRSEVRVSLEGDGILVISVAAEDIPALRAALNMWLRLLSVADEMLGISEAPPPGGKMRGEAADAKGDRTAR